ncbi:MAG: hypothetical protein A3I92_02620 [Candidatus Yanofskybacteria bacterium RIFCSPLOWO2_02_FULL_43_10b]|uniref:Uncharacterized protein n=1 Tax=Candidatus Yanofskybacteria bacterium RIFCSPLOWO2_02_FULL_43_10b TaxID=1802704 RepID=A0A1F8H2V1_9BACT|nr:MAG: hypothetical protein A3I92_02620 [Candidatus Yanofskybacteria bacterium RIFCSPLOWO2_02_FULL_43_10b]
MAKPDAEVGVGVGEYEVEAVGVKDGVGVTVIDGVGVTEVVGVGVGVELDPTGWAGVAEVAGVAS